MFCLNMSFIVIDFLMSMKKFELDLIVPQLLMQKLLPSYVISKFVVDYL